MIKRTLFTFGGLLLLALLLLPSSRVSAASSQVSKPLGNFAASCNSFGLAGMGGAEILYAVCAKTDGSLIQSTLNLNLYIGNDDGILAPNGHFFGGTCRSVTIDFETPVLDARCMNIKGELVNTTFDLNGFISNIDGTMVWE
jgi:hypothetical protein